jgi:hypothetical protein
MQYSAFNVIDVFVYSAYTDGSIVVGTFPVYIFAGLLFLLLVQTLLWTYTILKMVYKTIIVGQVC